MGVIGILGGTFDPVHFGHIRLAIEMRERLGLAEVRLLPAGQPRLRTTPHASATERLEMLNCAIRPIAGLVSDARELEGNGPTYTVETLASMRDEVGDTPLCLLIGMDAFTRLEAWYRWHELFDLCHIAVAHRTGAALRTGGALAEVVEERRCTDPARLGQAPAGRVIDVDAPLLDISATQIREAIASGRSIHGLVPRAVEDYISSHRLYSRQDS